jgi:hypothetical protein
LDNEKGLISKPNVLRQYRTNKNLNRNQKKQADENHTKHTKKALQKAHQTRIEQSRNIQAEATRKQGSY